MLYTYKFLHIRKRRVVQVRKIGGHDTRVGPRGQKGLYAHPSVYTYIIYNFAYIYLYFIYILYIYVFI